MAESIVWVCSLGGMMGVGAPAVSSWSADAPSTADVGIPEVVITARKVAESQQSVPVAVTALSGEDLETNAIIDVQQMMQSVPGLVVAPANQGTAPTFSVRASKHSIRLLARTENKEFLKEWLRRIRT